MLSGSDGRNICREIKDMDQMKDVSVIMVSAHPGAAENIGSYGADDFIGKPFNVETLIEKVEGLPIKNKSLEYYSRLLFIVRSIINRPCELLVPLLIFCLSEFPELTVSKGCLRCS